MARRILMIAYHFPPLAGSSGIQRTLRFAQYLPEFGWDPIVLTAHPRAYEKRSDDQLAEIGDGTRVIRAPAWNAARHFAVAGRYPGFLARPDRWASWWYGAVLAGSQAIRRYRPDVLWSTYPIATAHQIGRTLAHISGLPWAADFRDPMAQEDYPVDPATWRSFARIERRTVERAQLSTFTTPGAAEAYRSRYPTRAEHVHVLENGYDEESFSAGEVADAPLNRGRLTLVHSGVVYREERDPRELFAALRRLKQSAPSAFERLILRFRAPVHEDMLRAFAREHGVEGSVEILPPVGYRAALEEMLCADGLLVLQASNCNQQIPAKLYEYFRARRPIIALTDPGGDTARVARGAGIESIAPLDSPQAIMDLLEQFLREPDQGTVASEAAIASASRRARTEQFVELLDQMLG